MAEAKNIIPRKIENKVNVIQAKIEGNMATEQDLKDLKKLKKLYPSLF